MSSSRRLRVVKRSTSSKKPATTEAVSQEAPAATETTALGSTEASAFESLLAEREAAIEAAEQRCAWLAGELEKVPELDARILSLQRETSRTAQDLSARAAHIAELEGKLAQQRARSADLEEKLQQQIRATEFAQTVVLNEKPESKDPSHSQQLRSMEESHRAAIAQAQTAEDRVKVLEAEIASQQSLLQTLQREAEVRAQQLRASEEDRAAALASIEVAQMRDADHARELDTLSAELANLADIAAHDKTAGRMAEYEARLEALSVSQSQVVEALNADIAGQIDMLQTAQDQAAAAAKRAQTLDHDLRKAEDQMRTYEVELQSKEARMGELLRNVEMLQNQLEKAARSLEERDLRLLNLVANTGSGGSVLGDISKSIKRLRADDRDSRRSEGEDQAPAAAVARPMLVRTEGKREVVHMLGRKNSIGRTPDNDIQIDASYVSRHHAVILASPNFTLVEDLNSTNGVMVNGKKVNRHALNHGDVVKIGRAKFRFVSKPVDELDTRAQA